MSLDFYLERVQKVTVFDRNITHNLGEMAEKAGIYKHLWRPEEIGITKAEQMINPLKEGLARLRSDPQYFKKFNPQNGWGTYEGFIAFVEDVLNNCIEYSDSTIRICR